VITSSTPNVKKMVVSLTGFSANDDIKYVTPCATGVPSKKPTGGPTKLPTTSPSRKPSGKPFNLPSVVPSAVSDFEPSPSPSMLPSRIPIVEPTRKPTDRGIHVPTLFPFSVSTGVPSAKPMFSPSSSVSDSPSTFPSMGPSWLSNDIDRECEAAFVVYSRAIGNSTGLISDFVLEDGLLISDACASGELSLLVDVVPEREYLIVVMSNFSLAGDCGDFVVDLECVDSDFTSNSSDHNGRRSLSSTISNSYDIEIEEFPGIAKEGEEDVIHGGSGFDFDTSASSFSGRFMSFAKDLFSSVANVIEIESDRSVTFCSDVRQINVGQCTAESLVSPIKIVEQDESSVTYTVSQVWRGCNDEFTGHGFIAVDYLDLEGDLTCDTFATEGCLNTKTYTSQCTNGVTVVDLYVYDEAPDLFGAPDGAPIVMPAACSQFGDERQMCHFRYMLQCGETKGC